MKKVLLLSLAFLASIALSSCEKKAPPAANTPEVSPMPDAALTQVTAPTPESSLPPAASAAPAAESPIVYENESFGISIVLPADWEGKYFIKESENKLIFYSKNTLESDERGQLGELFAIKRVTGELIPDEELIYSDTREKIILRGNGYTYISMVGNGYEGPWPPEKYHELYNEYIKMHKMRDAICETARLYGTRVPEAKNPGFKVIGTPYFTAEIPESFTASAAEGSETRWNIYSEEGEIGSIEIVPRYSAQLPDDESFMRAYVLGDGERSFDAVITLSKSAGDCETLDKIKSSLELLRPYKKRLVEVLSRANECLREGGSKIVGKVIDFTGEGATGYTAKIALADCSASKDGEVQTETVPAHSTVYLVPQGQKYYSQVVEAGSLFEDELNKDAYYDFIINSDGKLEIMLEHYIP